MYKIYWIISLKKDVVILLSRVSVFAATASDTS